MRDRMPFNIMKTAPFLLSVLVLVGCANTSTVHLEPALVAQHCTSKHNEASDSYCVDINIFGSACTGSQGVIPANTLKEFTSPFPSPVVGWGDANDPGTEPFPCWKWVSTFSRGYVRFDLTKLLGPVESIESAAVSWKTKRLKGGSSKSCAKALYEATGPWKRGATPVTLLYDNLDTTAVSDGYYGVTKQVVNWWTHPNENYGLVFEPSRAKTVEKSDSACIDSLENLRLTVKYRQKEVKWPGH